MYIPVLEVVIVAFQKQVRTVIKDIAGYDFAMESKPLFVGFILELMTQN